MFETILLSFVIMLASLSGVIFIWKRFGEVIEKNLSYLVSFSAGVFLFVTYLLAQETIHHSESQSGGIGTGVFWIVLGIVLFFILFKLLPQFHHHHDEKEECDHPHSKIDARRILVSDGVHNIGDGILLATSMMASPAIGVMTAVSIFIHEFVQEVSEFFVLRQAGFRIRKALWVNFLVSATILIGAIGSYFLLETFEILEIPLLGIAAGSFLVVVLNDLIPHSIRNSHNKTHYFKHITWFIIGLVLMGLAGNIVSHSHDAGEHGHEHETEHHEELHHDDDHEYEKEHDHEDDHHEEDEDHDH
jgi:zinc transporter ZupT